MRRPELSIAVVIPTYNRAHFLKGAIDSTLSQTLLPAQVFVVDDASTDETPSLMKQWYRTDSRVHYISLSENRGPAHAREVGVQAAQTEWIAFLDSDDLWTPDHLEKAAQIISQNPQKSIIYAQRGHINEKSQVIIDVVTESWTGHILEVLLKRIIFRPSQIVVSRSIYQEVLRRLPPRARELYFVEDYIIGILFAALFPQSIHVSSHRTVFMRTHGNQSYHNAARLKNNLMKALDIVFSILEPLAPYENLTRSANLFHASYFMWRSGEWKEAWITFLEGVWREPRSIQLRDFWITLSRLVWPPQMRAYLKPER